MYFSAPWDRTKIVSGAVAALLAAVAVATRSPAAAGLGAVALGLAYAYSPRGYVCAPGRITVKRLAGDAVFPLNEVCDIRAATPDDLSGCLRLWGSGGCSGISDSSAPPGSAAAGGTSRTAPAWWWRSPRSHDGSWPREDPNHRRAQPYLASVPLNEGHPSEVAGGRTIGQAWGTIRCAPDLARPGFFDAIEDEAALVHSAAAPFLRPARTAEGVSATFDFASPYVPVDGTLDAQLAGQGVRLEFRTLEVKARNAAAPDVWPAWETLRREGGRAAVELGRPRFNGRSASIHGVYRFQLGVTVDPRPGRDRAAGLAGLRLALWFENGIMSIPRIFDGANTVRFRLRGAGRLRAPVEVTYRYRTAAGGRTHRQTLRPEDFTGGQTAYTLNAPGLVRCDSLAIAY